MKILGVKYDNITVASAIEQAVYLAKKSNKANVFFLNADCLYKAQRDEEYRKILNLADLVLPDGIGLEIATMLFGSRMKENCNGSDVSPLFLTRASKEGYKIFFLGAKEGIAKKAAENIQKQIPLIRIVGTRAGYFDDDDEVIKKINDSKADILFVAMGVPMQEKWIYRNREKLNPKLCLGVGALFDYFSGHIKRAPKIIRNIRMEWLWRIFMEPKRLWKRYLVDGIKFLGLVVKEKFKNY